VRGYNCILTNPWELADPFGAAIYVLRNDVIKCTALLYAYNAQQYEYFTRLFDINYKLQKERIAVLLSESSDAESVLWNGLHGAESYSNKWQQIFSCSGGPITIITTVLRRSLFWASSIEFSCWKYISLRSILIFPLPPTHRYARWSFHKIYYPLTVS
jgi:hypothetical protein